MQVPAVCIDVVIGNLIERIGAVPRDTRFARLKRRHRRLLRAQDNVVNLALPRTEMAADRKRARDVSRVHGIFSCSVDHNHVPGPHGRTVVRVVKYGGMNPRAHDRGISRTLTPTPAPSVLHEGRNLALVYARPYSFESGEVSSYRRVHGFADQPHLVRIFGGA